MTRDEMAAEVLKSLNACRARIASIGQITSESLKRKALLELELPHELALLLRLERIVSGGSPPTSPLAQGRPTGWDHIKKDD